LARFFESELAGDAAYCSRLEAEAEKHVTGHAAAWRTSGNSFGVAIDNKKVSLHPLYGAKGNCEFDLDLPDFLSLLRKWHELVK